jgi:hypothetical protein
VSPFFPTVVVSSRCSVRMRLGSDRGDVFAASMLIASARPGEAGLVTTSARIRAEKKWTYGNQARSFSLS